MTTSHAVCVGDTIADAPAIRAAVDRLAGAIACDYAGRSLVLIGVLKGALCFVADLARALAAKPGGPSEIFVDYVCVERYGAAGTRGRPPRLALDCRRPLAGAHVLIADGIADNGVTLAFLGTLLGRRKPASLRTCVLLDKHGRRDGTVKIDYLGLAVANLFVIGYGFDYKEHYRNIPYLAELQEGQTV